MHILVDIFVAHIYIIYEYLVPCSYLTVFHLSKKASRYAEFYLQIVHALYFFIFAFPKFLHIHTSKTIYSCSDKHFMKVVVKGTCVNINVKCSLFCFARKTSVFFLSLLNLSAFMLTPADIRDAFYFL